jgi:hypothetical protein
MQDVLTDDEEGDASKELKRFQKQYPDFAELVALNIDGVVVASVTSHIIGSNLSKTAAFEASRAGATYQGTLVGLTPDGVPALVFAAPIFAHYDELSVIGIVVGYLDWRHVEATLANALILGSKQDATHRLVLTARGKKIDGDRVVLYDSV